MYLLAFTGNVVPSEKEYTYIFLIYSNSLARKPWKFKFFPMFDSKKGLNLSTF